MTTQPPKKSERIEAYVASLGLEGSTFDPCYLAYFGCFNAGEYYEAHDVLEHLWLQGAGGNYAYFKGLIQFAGAFVHLRKQYERPFHPKDGRRLRPAVRLFALAQQNLSAYGPRHLGLDVNAVLYLGNELTTRIKASDFQSNPWSPETLPALHLRPE